jgi:cytosolic carboxypeptidase protein 2/3
MMDIAGPSSTQPFIFDGNFESGNLDMVVQVGPREFDLYMRVDSNTRGHHQWFFFKIKNQSNTGPVKINVLNFTKS